MSVDTRPLEPVARNSTPSELKFWTFAAYYNLWWTLRHGYSYSMVQTGKLSGYHPAWTKTRAIRDMVASPDCELVVFLDSDACEWQPQYPVAIYHSPWIDLAVTDITQPSYSIYDLLDRWGWMIARRCSSPWTNPSTPSRTTRTQPTPGLWCFAPVLGRFRSCVP
jgi:hypothetical protein